MARYNMHRNRFGKKKTSADANLTCKWRPEAMARLECCL
jgi:hypothetical protein